MPTSHRLGASLFAALRYPFWIAAVSGLMVCAGEFLINWLYFHESLIFPGRWTALFWDVSILFCFMMLLLALTSRLGVTILTSVVLYSVLISSDVVKLFYLDNPVRPTDLQYLADLRVVSGSFLSPCRIIMILVICAASAAYIWILWRKEAASLSRGCRLWIGAAAAVLLVSFFVLPALGVAREWLQAQGIELPEAYQYEPRQSARLNGLLVEWAMGAVDTAFRRPEGYERRKIERIARAHQRSTELASASNAVRPVNLIIYLIESFMDPQDLGIRFTYDPIPTFHAISRKSSSGRIVVPVFGGTSANTEFELLTGLSMYFLPDASCPYRQYLTQDIPSLPRFLHQHGYRTVAIPADPPYLFNRKAVYRHLGFDTWMFPEADPKTPRSPDNEFAADDAIADATIAASREGSPYFALAFTGGSHFPWDYPDYNNSTLDIVGPMAEPSRTQLKTYINALRVADLSLQKLIAHFEKTDQRTAILVMGDHLPALTTTYDLTGFFKIDGLNEMRKRYQVPAVLWCNWPVPKEDFVCSANFAAVHLLQVMGLRPAGSLALSADVYSRFRVLSRYVETFDGRFFAPHEPGMPFHPLLDDYRLIQYDLLMGKQFALGVPGWDPLCPM